MQAILSQEGIGAAAPPPGPGGDDLAALEPGVLAGVSNVAPELTPRQREAIRRACARLYGECVRTLLLHVPLARAEQTPEGARVVGFGDRRVVIVVNRREGQLYFEAEGGRRYNLNLLGVANQHTIFDAAGLLAAIRERHEALAAAELRADGEEAQPVLSGSFTRVILSAVRRVYPGGAREMRRCGGRVFFDQLDPECLRLAFQIGGGLADALLYTLVLRNRAEVGHVARVAPGVLPLWHLWARRRYLNGGADDWFRPDDRHLLDTPDILAAVKRDLERAGLSPRGWRYLIRLRPRWVDDAVCGGAVKARLPYEAAARYAARSMNLLAQAGCVPKYSTFVAAFRRALDIDAPEEALVAYLRAAFRESLRRPALLFAARFSDSADWWRECHASLDRNQTRAGWGAYQRLSDRWHAEAQARAEREQANYRWHSLVGETARGAWRVVPLLTTSALKEEGRALDHCVGGYTRECVFNRARVFSIRKAGGGEPVATLELRAHGEGPVWSLSQVRGYHNAAPTKAARAAAAEVLREYNRQQRLAAAGRRADVPPAENLNPDAPLYDVTYAGGGGLIAGDDDGEEFPF